MTEINGETSEGRIDMIRRGLSPREIEQAYREGIRQYARENGVRLDQITHAAKAWGIQHPTCRRKGDDQSRAG